MTIEDLEQSRGIRAEIRMLKQRIEELDELLLPGMGTDGVHSQNPSSPVENHVRQKLELEERLRSKLRELEREISVIDDWLQTVDDPQIRAIVQGRYIIGWGWRKVAREVYGAHVHRTTPYKALRKYCEK